MCINESGSVMILYIIALSVKTKESLNVNVENLSVNSEASSVWDFLENDVRQTCQKSVRADVSFASTFAGRLRHTRSFIYTIFKLNWMDMKV